MTTENSHAQNSQNASEPGRDTQPGRAPQPQYPHHNAHPHQPRRPKLPNMAVNRPGMLPQLREHRNIDIDTVEESIAEARKAAAAAGIESLDESASASKDRFRSLGLTSFAFHIYGLESASQATSLERDLNAIDGLEAVVVYSTGMAWLSAREDVSPHVVYDLLGQYGLSGHLTASSLRRRASRFDAIDPRRRRRQAAARERAVRAAERRRGAAARLSRETANNALHTARELVTKWRLFIAVIFGLPVVVLQMFPSLQFDWWQWWCLALTTVVVVWSGWPFHRALLSGVRRSVAALDGTSSLAILGAYLFSIVSLVLTDASDPSWRSHQVWLAGGWADPNFEGAIFFDVSCGVTILLIFGRLLSRRNQLRSKSSLAVLNPPKPGDITVIRKNRKGKPEKLTVLTTELHQGEDVLIPEGAIVPIDGEVISGKSVVDMGPVGGVDKTRELTVGDRIFAGARNQGETLKVRVQATGSHTRLSAMSRWFHTAVQDENRLAQLANRSATLLVPWALGIAMVNFFCWLIFSQSVDAAVATSLSVLAAVAPVALALSAPLALRLGLARAAAHGTLLRDTATIHRMAEVDSIIFNRLGTLTRPPMNVVGITPARGENPELVLRVASTIMMESDHAVSQAIVRADREARDANSGFDTVPSWLDVGEVNVTGDGTFTGSIDVPEPPEGKDYKDAVRRDRHELPANSDLVDDEELRRVTARVWRPRDLGELPDPHLASAALSGGSPVVVSWLGKDRGVINVADAFKDEAVDAIDELEDMEIETIMMSRDTYPVARHLADSIGISTVLAGVPPNRKAQTVRGVHARRHQVAVVGDKDSLQALRAADVGILMGTADRVEAMNADVVLIRDDVLAIPEIVNFVRHVRNTVDWNVWLSWIYNSVAVLAAVAGVLNPMAATVAMLLSSSVIEWRSSRILKENYMDSKMRRTHTWQAWWERIKQVRELRRRAEQREQFVETARQIATEEGREVQDRAAISEAN